MIEFKLSFNQKKRERENQKIKYLLFKTTLSSLNTLTDFIAYIILEAKWTNMKPQTFRYKFDNRPKLLEKKKAFHS